MVTTISQDNEFRGGAWQRATTRSAILAAARRVVERGGLDRLSLTAVAREADFAPTTVFAYYANKNDLLLSVLADDLAQFARTMRGLGPLGEPGPAPADTSLVPAVVEEVPAAVKLRLVDVAAGEQEYPALARLSLQRPEPASDGSREEIPERVVMDAFVQQLAELQDAVSRLETRTVDPWLERRFREFERGLAALQSRPEATHDSPPALTAVEVGMHALAARVESLENKHLRAGEDLARRLREGSEQIERRLREKLSEHEAAGARDRVRLDAVENAAFAVAPQYFQKSEPEQPPPQEIVAVPAPLPAAPELSHDETSGQAESPAQAPEAVDVVEAAETAEVPPTQAPEESFLAIARRSAMAAAEQNSPSSRTAGPLGRLSKRTLSYIAGGLGLAVALIWTGVYFRAHSIASIPASAAERTVTAINAHPAAIRHRMASLALKSDPRSDLSAALKLLDGSPGSEPQAALLLSRAADEGDAFAAFKLATLYKSGRGVAVDPARAFRWFQFAAAKGNCKAMQNLAVAYAEGWGTTKDMQEAARWFTRAAGLGLTDAQFNLAVLYERGLGVPQSLMDAYKWYLVAAAQGDSESRSRVDALKSQLPSTDLAAAEEAAAAFKPAPVDSAANAVPTAAASPAG